MKDQKKSFVLYSDIVFTVQKLSDEKAGQLFKIILEYVNGNSPIINDPLLEIAFEPIKQTLIRNAEKYNEIKLKRSLSGKLGGRPKDKSKTNQSKAKKANALLDNQTEAKKADSVIDSVNDNVSVNDNDIIISWRDNFEIYLKLVEEAKNIIFNDAAEIEKQQKFYPNYDIKLSIENAIDKFWGTEEGWKHKKKSKGESINMKTTLIKSIETNKVYKPKTDNNNGNVRFENKTGPVEKDYSTGSLWDSNK